MRNNERRLHCEQFTYEDAMFISRMALETDAVNVKFNCGRVEVWDVENDEMYEFGDIVAMVGFAGFTKRCVSICATNYQYFDDKWDILVVEEE